MAENTPNGSSYQTTLMPRDAGQYVNQLPIDLMASASGLGQAKQQVAEAIKQKDAPKFKYLPAYAGVVGDYYQDYYKNIDALSKSAMNDSPDVFTSNMNKNTQMYNGDMQYGFGHVMNSLTEASEKFHKANDEAMRNNPLSELYGTYLEYTNNETGVPIAQKYKDHEEITDDDMAGLSNIHRNYGVVLPKNGFGDIKISKPEDHKYYSGSRDITELSPDAVVEHVKNSLAINDDFQQNVRLIQEMVATGDENLIKLLQQQGYIDEDGNVLSLISASDYIQQILDANPDFEGEAKDYKCVYDFKTKQIYPVDRRAKSDDFYEISEVPVGQVGALFKKAIDENAKYDPSLHRKSGSGNGSGSKKNNGEFALNTSVTKVETTTDEKGRKTYPKVQIGNRKIMFDIQVSTPDLSINAPMMEKDTATGKVTQSSTTVPYSDFSSYLSVTQKPAHSNSTGKYGTELKYKINGISCKINNENMSSSFSYDNTATTWKHVIEALKADLNKNNTNSEKGNNNADTYSVLGQVYAYVNDITLKKIVYQDQKGFIQVETSMGFLHVEDNGYGGCAFYDKDGNQIVNAYTNEAIQILNDQVINYNSEEGMINALYILMGVIARVN